MSCPCDQFIFPPSLYIPAGLSRLPRQIATFPEFRSALLRGLGTHPALAQWRGRQPDDFGIMLLEMWAYVCDVVSFYDEVLADECYLRTAARRESLRKLVELLGYLARPAVSASVELAALADGRKALKLPAGTAFRSGAFAGNPPQVFELASDTVIHPLSNQWPISPIKPPTFGPNWTWTTSLLCQPGTVSVKKGDLVLVTVSSSNTATTVKTVSPYTGRDGASYTKVEFNDYILIPADTDVAEVQLLKPANRAPVSPLAAGSGEEHSFSPNPLYIYLDSIYRQIRTGQDVVLEFSGSYYARTVIALAEVARTVAPANTITFTPSGGTATSVTVPAVKTNVTKLSLNSSLYLVSSAQDGLDITVHFGFASAGSVTIEALTAISPSDPLSVPTPVEQPADADPPSRFQLADKNATGVALSATLDYADGSLELDQGVTWTPPLVPPLRLFGNLVSATHGASVNGEPLGVGDAAQANQTFKLKKNPLTYLSAPTADNDAGVASALKVYVDGILWSEVPTFFGVAAEATAYILRQNDQQESSVIFGDGLRGQRLSTGAQVMAYYRYGAGAAMPPAGSITQLAKPVTGLKSVVNPVAGYGGADAEGSDSLRKYAPRSALLLGRAVSLLDLEAAAANVGGVRAVRAEWRWNEQRQRPVAQIYYIGDPGLDDLITQKLRNLAEEDTPIDVAPATALERTLAIQVTVDPKYEEANVLAAVRAALMDPDTGLLSPERVGIGLPLYRSRIYEFVARMPGALSVAGLLLNGADFDVWAVSPGAGNYFDFEHGNLLLNGT